MNSPSEITPHDIVRRGLRALSETIDAARDELINDGGLCRMGGSTWVCSLPAGHAGEHFAFIRHNPVNGCLNVERWNDDPPPQKGEMMTVTPYLYTMIEVVYVDEAKNHDKFYRGFVDHQTFTVQYNYGRNGYWNQGSWTDPKPFPTFEKAHAAMMKQIQSKLNKGYTVLRSLTITCAQQPSLERLSADVNRPLYNGLDPELATSLVIANV